MKKGRNEPDETWTNSTRKQEASEIGLSGPLKINPLLVELFSLRVRKTPMQKTRRTTEQIIRVLREADRH